MAPGARIPHDPALTSRWLDHWHDVVGDPTLARFRAPTSSSGGPLRTCSALALLVLAACGSAPSASPQVHAPDDPPPAAPPRPSVEDPVADPVEDPVEARATCAWTEGGAQEVRVDAALTGRTEVVSMPYGCTGEDVHIGTCPALSCSPVAEGSAVLRCRGAFLPGDLALLLTTGPEARLDANAKLAAVPEATRCLGRAPGSERPRCPWTDLGLQDPPSIVLLEDGEARGRLAYRCLGAEQLALEDCAPVTCMQSTHSGAGIGVFECHGPALGDAVLDLTVVSGGALALFGATPPRSLELGRPPAPACLHPGDVPPERARALTP